jgi:hypothetical protein
MYIFTGPTPIKAVEQFQKVKLGQIIILFSRTLFSILLFKAFGTPKLPPLWSLGLQIGAKKYGNILHLRNFTKSFRDSKIPFVRFNYFPAKICTILFFYVFIFQDSVLIGYEHMRNATMFTLSGDFFDLNSVVDGLRSESRAAILQLV